MTVIATDGALAIGNMLDTYECPAILVSPNYEILATNALYKEAFGELQGGQGGNLPRCYAVSHGYDRPCDQAGETCPLQAATDSKSRERVLHIHQTPKGEEHVDVEMLPIFNRAGELEFFIELLRPLPVAREKGAGRAMVGRSAAFNSMLALLSRVAREDVAVLLTGESGAGKELAAHAVHRNSNRAESHMVTLECAGLTETLFESELFGHVRGAFTGANFQKPGLVEAAKGGTLFLDEIGDVPLTLQVKLLRLIETGTYRRVGSTEIRHADFRLVCATHKNLEELVAAGQFREDLYYRINVFPVHVPALRERPDDLPLIANALLGDLGGGKSLHLTESAIDLLKQQRFPGNVRQLRNILARAVILANTNVIDRAVIEGALAMGAVAGAEASPGKPAATAALGEPPSGLTLRDMERSHLADLMRRFAGDKQQVAQAAGISVRSLYRKLAP